VTMRQTIRGIPVFGSTAKFIVNSGLAVTQANFNLATATSDVVTTRTLSDEDAGNRAKSYYGDVVRGNKELKDAEVAMFGSAPAVRAPKLELFDPTTLGAKTTPGLRLSWEVGVGGMIFFVDANSGGLLFKYRDVRQLAVFQANDSKVIPGASTPVYHETIGDLVASPPSEARKAVDNAKVARVFYQGLNRDILGKSSCDPILVEPIPVVLNIRSSFTNNSFWDHGGRAAYFSEDYANNLDIVGHELTHGVSDFVSCLQYAGDSAAVSEFLADFFAVMMRHKTQMIPEWVIGNGLRQYAPPSQPLRSLENPNLNGFNPSAVVSDQNRGQPETMAQKVDRDTDVICASSLDSLYSCAHFNSGILNKAAFLATSGGQFNGQMYTGVGFEKMTAIMNETLSELDELMDFPRTAGKISTACQKLQGLSPNNITAADCGNVFRAFQAVGITPVF
jgi:Zn-dependent metalloprotease